MDSLYKLFNYRINGNIVVKSGQVFENVQRSVCFNGRNRGMERMPSVVKKRLLREKYRKHLLRSSRNTKTLQTSGSVFAERVE